MGLGTVRPAGKLPGASIAIGAALVALTALVFGAVVTHGFVALDDGTYVLDNPHVREGLGIRGLAWAVTSFHGSNWHPLTWLSHMLDVELFGLRAGGHHLTSLLLHAATSVALFAALAALTGARWRSALVAALFAAHPLHVESVAWVAERKDVLCAFFWTLALLAWRPYAARPSQGRYAAAAAAFAGALLAKPMAVTLPFVLLLLDFWPLGRWRPAGAGGRPAGRAAAALVVEKLPLFALAAASSAVTVLAQGAGGALGSTALYPFGLRAANALLSVAAYARQALWPADLAVFYPFPRAWPAAPAVAAAAAFVCAGCLAAWLARRARPWLTFGWLWYLGTLVPVLGLVQAGDQARADRYTYLPLTGLFVAAAWAAGAWAGRDRARRAAAGVAAALALAALGVAGARQVRAWRDSEALFAQALRAVPQSPFARVNLGAALIARGETHEAKRLLLEAVRLDPARTEPYLLLADALVREGDPVAARAALDEGLRLSAARTRGLRETGALADLERRIAAQPDRGVSWQARTAEDFFALGMQRRWRGEPAAAEAAIREAVRLRPAFAVARRELARVLDASGRRDEAFAELAEAVRLDPDDPVARNLFGIALGDRGRVAEAREQFSAAVRLRPDSAETRVNLGRALEMLGRRDEAARQYREALRINPELEAARRRLEAK